MTNTTLLREIIESKGLKLKFVAEKIGLTPNGFALKLNNKQEFKTGEISALCDLLNIDSLELKEKIFFNH